jgi:spermidine/putrescine transport system ATP-binding protein
VALARAIICEPRVVLLDEPLAALDAGLRRSMQEFLKDLQRRIRTTFVFITHDQEEAIAMSDRIVVMDHGRVEQVGTPKEIYYRPRSEFVARFFGENNLLPARAAGGSAVDSPLGRHVLAATGNPTAVAIRPESLSLNPKSGPGAERRSATGAVESLTFLGATTQIVVRLSDDKAHSVKIRLPTPEFDGRADVGDPISVFWSDADVSVLGA